MSPDTCVCDDFYQHLASVVGAPAPECPVHPAEGTDLTPEISTSEPMALNSDAIVTTTQAALGWNPFQENS